MFPAELNLPATMNPQRMPSELDRIIEDACSNERLEVYLTPKHRWQWTVRSLRARPGASGMDHLPSVRLYVPAAAIQSADVEPELPCWANAKYSSMQPTQA